MIAEPKPPIGWPFWTSLSSWFSLLSTMERLSLSPACAESVGEGASFDTEAGSRQPDPHHFPSAMPRSCACKIREQ